jgi:hypothetical protein
MMKIVNVIRDYLPHDKCDELNLWVRDAIANKNIDIGITTAGSYKDRHREPSPMRYTSRMYSDRYQYPQLVRDIHAQIERDFGLERWHYPVHTHGRDGTVVSATMPGGDVYLHKDPMATFTEPLLHTLRCNILTSETEGGLIWVADEPYTLKKGDMMQYVVSRHEHKVETVIGEPDDLRIMWMFGWCVDADIWEASINE